MRVRHFPPKVVTTLVTRKEGMSGLLQKNSLRRHLPYAKQARSHAPIGPDKGNTGPNKDNSDQTRATLGQTELRRPKTRPTLGQTGLTSATRAKEAQNKANSGPNRANLRHGGPSEYYLRVRHLEPYVVTTGQKDYLNVYTGRVSKSRVLIRPLSLLSGT